MRRIDDPFVLRDCLERFSGEPLTPAQARLLLAARGIRARQKIIEEAVWGAPKRKRRAVVRRASLEELPLTPQERASLERWRRG
ncbi:hypothetical protein Mesil_3537 (plasmid) [Allomeiothermus silvanus DSM 9946]|uniref:Uncharacterized protein n=1 Tax=Allomeiothermus silvanus (strain ATCC 700542 / DSM 9946 / NBRC 106475 / NCIMB 13440 / VI-R2) TaxID=526227 RepID=D7BJH6_ALLS1|nr:hypothetical protein [Allomeiothermus silvanus]ADH65332.1 hypothetical protein Mesil_3537 [Allomeiothermus silvanus DSM 9946]